MGDSSDAIREFTVTAREFVRAAERLPELARWQVELLLYDFEDRDTVIDSVASFQALGSSASRMSESIARLPEDMRASGVAAPLREAAQSIQLASASWESILMRDDGPTPAASESSSFQIAEWESAGREFGRTAVQLRELAVELRDLGNGSGPFLRSRPRSWRRTTRREA